MSQVSIVVPVYNAAPYIEKTLESLVTQTYKNLEIIVVDDGSTDGSAEILKRWSNRVKVVVQANAGQSAALTNGWKQSKGEILGYLGADDLLDKESVRLVAENLLRNPAAVAVYPDYRLIDAQGEVLRTVVTPNFDFKSVVGRLVCPPGPGMLFRRSAYEKAGPWRQDLRQMPDFEFLLRLGLCGPIERRPQDLASFRVHEGSQSFAKASVEKSEEPVAVMSNFFARADLPMEIRQLQKKSMAFAHVLAMRLHVRSGRWTEGRKHLRQAMKGNPALLLDAQVNRILANAIFGRAYYRVFKGVR